MTEAERLASLERKTRPPAYDPACGVLADHFLPAGIRQAVRDALAQRIQEEVEDWLQYSEHAEEIAAQEMAADLARWRRANAGAIDGIDGTPLP